ncbi:MAG TPA: hypothetical protein VFS73_08170 [Solirubrobacterales bacterium]|jgi:hypothetical protein|nr:hypothetical protein [Solirubrobacterales bacterium]
MRKALNENPMVQLAVLGVCAIVFAVILFTSVLKKDEQPAATTTSPAATTTSDPAASSDPSASASTPSPSAGSSASGAAPATPETDTVTPPAGGATADGLLPSKGLPEDVLVAFARNKAIALLVVDPKGLSDKQLEQFTDTLRSRDDVEVFVVNVKDIAKYARITAGVSVSRTPALVVVRPRKLTDSTPTAAVSYGFRGPRSVNQAVDDALYDGKQVPSYP